MCPSPLGGPGPSTRHLAHGGGAWIPPKFAGSISKQVVRAFSPHSQPSTQHMRGGRAAGEAEPHAWQEEAQKPRGGPRRSTHPGKRKQVGLTGGVGEGTHRRKGERAWAKGLGGRERELGCEIRAAQVGWEGTYERVEQQQQARQQERHTLSKCLWFSPFPFFFQGALADVQGEKRTMAPPHLHSSSRDALACTHRGDKTTHTRHAHAHTHIPKKTSG